MSTLFGSKQQSSAGTLAAGSFNRDGTPVTPASATVTPTTPIVPTVTPTAVMPDTNSPSAIEAQRMAQANVLKRAGRTSTILTAPNNRGNSGQNFDTYSAAKTGAA